ncbi:MAG: DUF397 domain-containing protein [Streptosporangiaceae bacterium]
MPSPDLSRAVWRTSTRSGGNGNCVEVAANLHGVVAVRDSKDRTGPILIFGHADWEAFTAKLRGGAPDLR